MTVIYKILPVYIFVFLFAHYSTSNKKVDLTRYVNPFIGTADVGHTFPGATIPFGMVQLSPDTRKNSWSACSGYNFSDTSLYGFSHTHLSGTGGADLADILFLPTIKKDIIMNMKAGFDKNTETASPGYYGVTFKNGIEVELTASVRCGIHKYTYPGNSPNFLYIDLFHKLSEYEKLDTAEFELVSETMIRGSRLTNGWGEEGQIYFVAKLSRPIKNYHFKVDGKDQLTKKVNGKNIVGMLEFEADNQALEISVGISATGYDGAMKNLTAEVGNKQFSEIKSDANKKWNEHLSKIIVEGTDTEKTIFYSALYHSLIHPSTFNDVDGKYRGMDFKNHRSDKPNFHVFSFWDTFRAVHPLYTLIEQELAGEMINSLLKKYQELGRLPKWELWSSDTDVMIGNHAVAVIADAMLKDVKGFDYEMAYQACKSTISDMKEQLDLHVEYGYIPYNMNQKKSVSKSLEYAYNDWCMARMAEKLGHTEDYELFVKRANNYKHLFNGENGFFVPRDDKGIFSPNFIPSYMGEEFTEATPWQYRHFVLHDALGLSNLLGGRDSLANSNDYPLLGAN